MSSILDALNKVEEERAAQLEAEQGFDTTPVAPEEAAAALLGQSPKKTAYSTSTVSWTPIISALSAGIAVIALVVGMVIIFTTRQTEQVAVAPTTPETVQVHTYTMPVQSQRLPVQTIPPAPPLAPATTQVTPIPKPPPIPPAPSRQIIAAIPPPAQIPPPMPSAPVPPVTRSVVSDPTPTPVVQVV
ncbi:MAG: hypothetical protein KAH38_10015, partial [Candidatus Hydrogenedentes bacterium]|nr:hypothetical protein [Candidatus Hydrogenedentota bacterium]